MLVNAMEELTRHTLNEHLDDLKMDCTCEKCQLDTLALALNWLPAQYYVNNEGRSYVKAKYMDSQESTKILSVLAEAAQIVSKHKSHQG
ncbi:late competence development ComFB family protein [Salsuginibacillus kocurii]|uniref:late competence development ComFB family protein n=1 Tax=Salsuginibacillus kocurii TaxID=427078 RepID=UPI00035D104D|nr:late competence development ComFB family protein [Salsuginibacillus kocurii]